MKNTKRSFYKLIFIFVFLLNSFSYNNTAQAQTESDSNPESIEPISYVVGSSTNQNTSPTVSTEFLGEMNTEQFIAMVAQTHQKSANAGFVVATDDEPVLVKTAALAGELKAENKFRLLPLSFKEKIQTNYRIHQERVKKTLKEDKLTVILLTITTGIDSFIWIQATSLSFPQKLSMLSYNLLIAATFGLDRDLWGNINKPLKEKLFSILDKLSGGPETKFKSEKIKNLIEKTKMMTSQFSSYFMWGTVFYVLRTSLLSFENLQTTLISNGYWDKALTIMTLSTATHFTWAEMNTKVNAETNPIAKNNLKRLADLRGIIISLFASISMVLQPHIYGHTPMIAFIIHGTLGFLAFKNIENVINYLENNPKSIAFYKSTQGIEVKINKVINLFKFKKTIVLKCETLFSN